MIIKTNRGKKEADRRKELNKKLLHSMIKVLFVLYTFEAPESFLILDRRTLHLARVKKKKQSNIPEK